MARRSGPAPTPTEKKRLLGNPGKRALPAKTIALAPVVVMPRSAPSDDIVSAILETGASAWISEPDRLVLLETLRDLWDERRALRRAADDLPPEWVLGRYVPAVLTRLEKVEKSILECVSMLGLSPTDRARLGVAEVKARSKLEEMRERRSRMAGRPAG